MNNNAKNGATDQTVTFDNEVTIYAAIFDADAPSATAAAASAIFPDAHFLSSRLKLDTDIFPEGKINSMADKDTIDTTPATNALETDTPEYSSQYAGSTDSNSPYSLRNHKFTPYSTKTTKNRKRRKGKLMIKLQLIPPLTPTHPALILPMLPPNIMDPPTTIYHIH